VLRAITPARPNNSAAPSIPALLAPLWLIACAGDALEPEIIRIVRSFGFDSFMYGMSTAPQPHRDSRSFVWTTLSREWVSIYDQKSYIEIDPRLTQTWRRVTPILWDRHSHDGDARVASFLNHAAQYGVGSGVAVPLRDPSHPLVVVALNSGQRELTALRRHEITTALGDIVLLASHFHELFMASFVDSGLPPRQQGAPLSPREVQCLQFAAHGLTSGDIGKKLGLVERTVNFHFSNIISKLAAANRGEAIAVAIARGIIVT